VEHRLDSEVCEVILALADDLGAESSGGALAEVAEVILLDVDGLGDLLNLLDSNFTSLLETISDLEGVDALVEEFLSLF